MLTAAASSTFDSWSPPAGSENHQVPLNILSRLTRRMKADDVHRQRDAKPKFPQRSTPAGPATGPSPSMRVGQRVLQFTTVAAVGLFLLLLLFLPRATFQIERVEFITTSCDPVSQSHQVTAAMSIRNTGTAGGVASVRLLVDGQIAVIGHYEIPAHESVQRGLSAAVFDCQWHRFAVELFVEPSGGG